MELHFGLQAGGAKASDTSLYVSYQKEAIIVSLSLTEGFLLHSPFQAGLKNQVYIKAFNHQRIFILPWIDSLMLYSRQPKKEKN